MTSLKSVGACVAWLGLLCVTFLPSSSPAASRALVVSGLSGSSANSEEFNRLSVETKRLLVERGIPLENITQLGDKASREDILKALADAKVADDEFWLVLYGHSARSQGGIPAFQIRGPRLTANDLRSSLDAIPARQFILIGTNDSGSFLPILQSSQRSVVSATKMEAESEQPRFPAAWIEALSENPKASFPWIAARASQLVSEGYKNASLAQIEHARLADPVTGTILEPPFGVNLDARPELAVTSGNFPPTAADIADIEVKITDPNALWEDQPATEETKKLIAEAKAIPNPDEHSAIMMDQMVGLTVEEDRTTDRKLFHRVYLVREDAIADWANAFLPQSPPIVTSKLEIARVIHPDGSATVFNPAKLPAATDCTSGVCGAMAMVYLPKVEPGCIVEIGYRVRQMLNAALPEVTETLPIQQKIPALATQIEIKVPENKIYHVALKNSDVTPEESVDHGRKIFRWALGPQKAAESLPGDPPACEWVTWLGVSSLPSWEKFAVWYRRIAAGSDAVDDTVRETARGLVATAETREEKIQRLFEFVSALRYVAVELGIQGFRPRTPAQVLNNRFGDCKDKANLLIALLSASGIEANFVLLNRGSATDVSLPSWQFNHAICYVPGEGKNPDLWLDATDSVTPYGYVPPGDAGRQGFVIGKDKAEFKVVGGNPETSLLSDTWVLEQNTEGGWSGSFQRTGKGLAEYTLRERFHGLTPAQRRQVVCASVSTLWPGSDTTGAEISNVSALGKTVKVEARVASSDSKLPLPDFPWLQGFSAPERDRPLQINDGQPFTTRQTVRLTYPDSAPQSLPPPLILSAGGQNLAVTWKQIDAHTIERTAMVEIRKPVISPAEYAEVRKALRTWTTSIAAR
ncbi:DUF3857 domain-containing protein [Terrimicrobium sacchariphilum]|uniref:DUF3857 domain-containing protein n=1 Tax=Terrimicrobium sacchariphilum TaxID=690879 RepID=UPI00129BDDF6|nr:DUF3857 domain-containing protein [Terrimicrobium sacchariphilum]